MDLILGTPPHKLKKIRKAEYNLSNDDVYKHDIISPQKARGEAKGLYEKSSGIREFKSAWYSPSRNNEKERQWGKYNIPIVSCWI